MMKLPVTRLVLFTLCALCCVSITDVFHKGEECYFIQNKKFVRAYITDVKNAPDSQISGVRAYYHYSVRTTTGKRYKDVETCYLIKTKEAKERGYGLKWHCIECNAPFDPTRQVKDPKIKPYCAKCGNTKFTQLKPKAQVTSDSTTKSDAKAKSAEATAQPVKAKSAEGLQVCRRVQVHGLKTMQSKQHNGKLGTIVEEVPGLTHPSAPTTCKGGWDVKLDDGTTSGFFPFNLKPLEATVQTAKAKSASYRSDSRKKGRKDPSKKTLNIASASIPNHIKLSALQGKGFLFTNATRPEYWLTADYNGTYTLQEPTPSGGYTYFNDDKKKNNLKIMFTTVDNRLRGAMFNTKSMKGTGSNLNPDFLAFDYNAPPFNASTISSMNWMYAAAGDWKDANRKDATVEEFSCPVSPEYIIKCNNPKCQHVPTGNWLNTVKRGVRKTCRAYLLGGTKLCGGQFVQACKCA